MASGAKDIQFRELKDTISQLNITIRTQNDLITSLQKMLEDRNAKDDEKDRIILNLHAQLEYFKQKLFGSSSERRSDLPGQLSLFSESGFEEESLPELIEVKTSQRERKPKANYDEMFANLSIIRRYLMEAIPKGHEKDYSHPAAQGVLYCNKLFEYERSYKEKGLSYAQVYKRRQKDQKPVVEGFMRWLDAQRSEKGSRMDRAVTYIRNRKDTLMTYLEDGRCSLSNNPSENSIRPLTLGRKNWLFSESQDGANASMVVYTMVEMAKVHGLHPYNYLQYLLDSRPGKDTTDAEFQDLAPWSEKAKIGCNKKSE